MDEERTELNVEKPRFKKIIMYTYIVTYLYLTKMNK